MRHDQRMSIYLKRVLGLIALVLLVMYEGAFLVATPIGLSTTADDAANLPKWFTWLVETPWWVPSLLIPAALLGFAVWVFWPDHSLAKTAEAARRDLKASNDKAWDFAPKLEAVLERLAEIETKLEQSNAVAVSLVANADYRSNQFAMAMNEVAELKKSLTITMQSSLEGITMSISVIQQQIDNLETKQTALEQMEFRISIVESQMRQLQQDIERRTPL